MSTLLRKRYCVLLSFLFIISSLECSVFGGVNSAESYSLSEEDGKHSREESVVSRERKSVDEEDDGTKDGSREAQLLSNRTSPLPVNSSIAPSTPIVLTEGGNTLITQAIGSSEGSATVGPTQHSPDGNETSTSESATAAPTPTPTPTPTIIFAVSTEQTSLRGAADTQNATVIPDVLVTGRTTTTTIDETTEEDEGSVRGRVDPHDGGTETLFGFVTVEILIALLAGAACAVLLVAFLVYRIKKRSEGSYELTVNYSKKTYSGKDSEKEVFV